MRVITSAVDFGFHVVSFEGVLSKEHEVEKNSKGPNIHRYPVVTITDDFRSHILLSSTVGLGSHPSNGPGKPEICNFVGEFAPFSLEEDVLAFDIPMNEVSLMDAFESFHNFY